MIAKFFGSGSAGNCMYFESTTGDRLVIDMGFSFKKIKEFLNFRLDRTTFLITHVGHQDHSKAMQDAIKSGCDVQCYFENNVAYKANGFLYTAFDVVHNVKTHGFMIHHEECGTVVFLTDSGPLNMYFKDVNHWFVEANFCEEYVEEKAFRSGETYLAERIFRDHQSIQELEKLILRQDLSKTETFCLLHMSDSNSNEQEFMKRIRRATGKPVYAAQKGLQIDLSKWQ